MVTLQITVQNKYHARFILLMLEVLKQTNVEDMITEANIRGALEELENFHEKLNDTEADVMGLAIKSAAFMANLFAFLESEIEKEIFRQNIMRLE